MLEVADLVGALERLVMRRTTPGTRPPGKALVGYNLPPLFGVGGTCQPLT